MADFSIKSGDTAPAITATLYDGPDPLDLTSAVVTFRMRLALGGDLVIDAPASIVGDEEDGVVTYQWVDGDTDEPGDYEVEWFVQFAGGDEQTFPTQGYTTLVIEPSLTDEDLTLPDLPDSCWPVDHGCCSEFDEYPASVRATADALAAQTMRMLTGYSVGGCPVLLRPCSTSCASASGSWYWGGGTFHPYINSLGSWVNGCGCTSTCGCTSLSTVYLGGYIRGGVVEVKVDGEVLDPDLYAVHNGTQLVRLDGELWPVCQDMALADTEVGTFSVKVQRGAVVDGLGAYAAGRLACEYAKACSGRKCALPANVTSVTRQGITMELAADAFPGGLTGIREVDLIIQRYNPNHLKRPAAIYSPDLPGGVVVT